jgi:hypothetical protein
MRRSNRICLDQDCLAPAFKARQGHGEGKPYHQCQEPEDCTLQRRDVALTPTTGPHAKPTADLAGGQDYNDTSQEDWHWGHTLDPYGVRNLAAEERQVQRVYFARSPGSNIWVSFDDLPSEVCNALWAKLEQSPDFE